MSAGTTGGTWSCTNTSVATIDASGNLVAVSVGVDSIYYAVSNACGSTLGEYTVTVITTPTNAGVISGTSSICITHSITLSETVPGGTWSTSNSNASVSAGGVVTGLAAGTDSVFYTVTNPCGSISTYYIVTVLPPSSSCTPLGATNMVVNDKIIVYPNPSNGTFRIELPNNGNPAIITIVNLMGEVVASKNVSGNTNLVDFELNNLPTGNYIVRVNIGGEVYREKVIIW